MQIDLLYLKPNRRSRIRSLKRNDDSTLPSINHSQMSLPSIKVDAHTHPWIYQDDYDFLKDAKHFFKLPDDNNSPYINRKQQTVKLLKSIDLTNDIDIEERFSFVLKYLKQAKLGNLYNVTVLVYSYVLSRLKQYDKAIQVWLKYLVFCNSSRGYKYKIIAYKHLAELHMNNSNFYKALIYCKKYLKYSLYFNQKNQELNCYELVGKILYYMQQSSFAKAFHEKFLDGVTLAENDSNRLQAIRMLDFEIRQKQQASKIDTDSEEEFELEKIVDPKGLFIQQVRLREVLINKKNLWGHVRKQSEPLGPMDGRVIDQKLFQKEFYTQLSNNSSVKNFLKNNPLQINKKVASQLKIVDKLIFDIQQF